MSNDRRKKLAIVLVAITAAIGFAASAQDRKVRIWLPGKAPADVRFVGKQACAECHRSIVAVQSESSMGKALELAADSKILSENKMLTFKEGAFSFEIVRKDNQSIYTVTDGKETVTAPILYAFGQGKAGQTYVLAHNGDYYESRVSFYADTKALDLTIGYRDKPVKSVIEAFGSKLPIDEITQCFICHTTGTVAGGKIHTEKLTPGISCEACHGPGGDHIAAWKSGQSNRDKIFNPGRLGGDELSQEFCGACHRSVDEIIVRPNQEGLSNVRFQPYRIFNSKCYSDDRRISCIACHDPHESVKQDTAHYDAKCAACHQKGETSAANNRVCRVDSKNCASCHMPKIDLPGAHFKFTDHRIRISRPGEKYPL